jgi:hypothetical protein
MRPLSDLQKNNSFRLSSDTVESLGDESLICDTRSQVRSTELVERKLQMALRCNRTPNFPIETSQAN